ncbi:MAG TPA: hypothetical protein VGK73_31730 [Polyangiaceae bacterium]
MAEPTQDEIKAELRKRAWIALRKNNPLLYRARVKQEILAGLTRKQQAVIDDLEFGVRYIALCCSRRAGKTQLLARLLILTMLKAGHNEAVFYVASTLKIGKGLIWKEIVKIAGEYELDSYWRFKENEGEIHTPEGAAFFILGLNKQKQSNQTRGFKALLFCTDESQDIEHLLGPLLTAVAPSLTDSRGSFIAAGTPGYVPQGTWFDWVHQRKGGFKTYSWTVKDNEKFPQYVTIDGKRQHRSIDQMLAEEREREGWTEEHPDYQREWLGRWVEDVSTLLCEFLNERNSITKLPDHYSLRWTHVIGIDFGFNDAATWVVLAGNPFGTDRIVVHAEAHSGLDNDEAAEITSKLVKRFETTRAVCDPSGGGKTFFETFNKRYGSVLGCKIKAAYKLHKYDSVKAINTDLRCTLPDSATGRLSVLLPEAEPLAKELRVLRWKDREKGDVLTSATVTDNVFDGFRMAHVELVGTAPRVENDNDRARVAQIEERKALQDRLKTDEEFRDRHERNQEQQRVRKQRASGFAYVRR